MFVFCSNLPSLCFTTLTTLIPPFIFSIQANMHSSLSMYTYVYLCTSLHNALMQLIGSAGWKGLFSKTLVYVSWSKRSNYTRLCILYTITPSARSLPIFCPSVFCPHYCIYILYVRVYLYKQNYTPEYTPWQFNLFYLTYSLEIIAGFYFLIFQRYFKHSFIYRYIVTTVEYFLLIIYERFKFENYWPIVTFTSFSSVNFLKIL